jgi:hypothetical protein
MLAPPARRSLVPLRRRVSAPSDWGMGMTVCIAAACETSKTLVMASDRLLSWGHTSSDTVLKFVRLHSPYWIVMMAGDDLTKAEEVVADARKALSTHKKSLTVAQVRSALRGAWRNAQNEIGAAAILNPFRLDVPTFVRDGKKRFGEAKFFDLAGQLQHASKVECVLLACGFDNTKRPVLLVCDDEAGCRDFSRASYVAIGSGQSQALASLAFHDYDSMCSLEQAIYHVCVAKFMAEKSIGVGKDTMVLCMNQAGQTKWIFKSAITYIRALWEQDGRPRIPPAEKISTTISPILSQLKWEDL